MIKWYHELFQYIYSLRTHTHTSEYSVQHWTNIKPTWRSIGHDGCCLWATVWQHWSNSVTTLKQRCDNIVTIFVVPTLFTFCSNVVHVLFQSWFVPMLFTICSSFVHVLFQLWFVPALFTICFNVETPPRVLIIIMSSSFTFGTILKTPMFTIDNLGKV